MNSVVLAFPRWRTIPPLSFAKWEHGPHLRSAGSTPQSGFWGLITLGSRGRAVEVAGIYGVEWLHQTHVRTFERVLAGLQIPAARQAGGGDTCAPLIDLSRGVEVQLLDRARIDRHERGGEHVGS